MAKQNWRLILLAVCLIFAFSTSPAEAGGEKGTKKCNDSIDNDDDGKIDGEDEDCFSAFKPDRDNSGRGNDVPLIVTLDNMPGDNLVSDGGTCRDDERGVSASAGGQLPPRILVGFNGKGGKDPRELTITVMCEEIPAASLGGVAIDRCAELDTEFGDPLVVTGRSYLFSVIPYEVNCIPTIGDCTDVFAMGETTRLMSFSLFGGGGVPRIEAASDIGGATSVDAGRCLSLLTAAQRDAFLSENCTTEPSDCNVTITASDTDGDPGNDAWRIDSLGVTALICTFGAVDEEPAVLGQTTLTFGFNAEKE